MAGEKINDFRDLRVWNDAMSLAESVYKASRAFPPEEISGLTSQIRRAAVSIPSNIAEGHARAHLKEYVNFLSIAQGSIAELETQLILARRIGFLHESDYTSLDESLRAVRRQLYALRTALTRNLKTGNSVSEDEVPYIDSC
jgi:four helix bundle protein